MLFTDLRILISDDPTGKELKEIGDRCKLKYSWYFSHILPNGVQVRYFQLTRVRARNLLPFFAGFHGNKTDQRIYRVGKRWVSQYIKYGKIGKVDIQYNINKIMAHTLYFKLFKMCFGVTALKSQLEIIRMPRPHTVIYSTTITFKLVFDPYKISAYIGDVEVELPEKVHLLLNKYLDNKTVFNQINC